MKWKLYLLFVLLLVGCGGTKAFITSGDQVNFEQYKTVKLVVTDAVKNEYSAGAIPLFEGMLKAKLLSLGFKNVENQSDLLIELEITRAQPGNKALRMIVGFGAGGVRIEYKTIFKNRLGNIIAEYSGWEGEFMKEQIHWDSDRLRLELVRVCVDKIAKFIKTGKETEQ